MFHTTGVLVGSKGGREPRSYLTVEEALMGIVISTRRRGRLPINITQERYGFSWTKSMTCCFTYPCSTEGALLLADGRAERLARREPKLVTREGLAEYLRQKISNLVSSPCLVLLSQRLCCVICGEISNSSS